MDSTCSRSQPGLQTLETTTTINNTFEPRVSFSTEEPCVHIPSRLIRRKKRCFENLFYDAEVKASHRQDTTMHVLEIFGMLY